MQLHTLRRARNRATSLLGGGLAVAAMTTGLLLPAAGSAHAQSVETGSLGFTSDPGDYIGQGETQAYSTTEGDRLAVNGRADNGYVSVGVSAVNGDSWSLALEAPSGEALAPGEYTGATRYPFNDWAQPGLSFTGNGRGCNQVTGSFTITKVTFGPQGYVEELDATFEQHCEGGTAALRGEVHVTNPPAPPELELGVDVAADGTASTLNGKATVHGTTTCNAAAKVYLSGRITQVVKRVIVNGDYSTSVECTPGEPVPWTATATPDGTTPFQKGDVEVQATASAQDPNYDGYARAERTATVSLDKAKP